MPSVYVLAVPEFNGLVTSARANPAIQVTDTGAGYFLIQAQDELTFDRRQAGFKPAIWYGAFTGGIDGKIVQFDRDTVRIVNADDGR